MGISFLFSFAFRLSFFHSSDSHFAFLHFFFLEIVLIPASCTMSQTYVHSSSGTPSIRSNPLNLPVTFTVYFLRDLIQLLKLRKSKLFPSNLAKFFIFCIAKYFIRKLICYSALTTIPRPSLNLQRQIQRAWARRHSSIATPGSKTESPRAHRTTLTE